MRAFWSIIQRYRLELFVIGAIRIFAGKDAAQRYIDSLSSPPDDTETKA